MKVTATQMGYFDHHIRERGDKFNIPDTPTRKIRKAETEDGYPKDDAVTQQAAVKGEIPCAFSSHWMRPGWGVGKAVEEPAAPADEAKNDESPI